MSKRLDGERGVSLITDHRFTPRDEWWELCQYCGLGESAHSRTKALHPRPKTYRCSDCVKLDIDPCPHQAQRTPRNVRESPR